MKKLFAIILTIVMALSATACSNSDTPAPNGESRPATGNNKSENTTTAPEAVGEPTEEELEQIQAYARSVSYLNDWVNGKTTNVYYYDEETKKEQSSTLGYGPDYASSVLEYHYNVIQNCPAVDKWAGTQWASNTNINWDRQAVLDSFTILEDVALYETAIIMDHLDNVKENIVVHRYYYNELSQLTELKFINYPNAIGTQLPFEFIETNPTESFSGNYILSYEYNENGQVTVKKVVAIGSGDVLNKITAAYNEDGTLATLTDMSNGGDTAVATYVYDSQQRVAEIQVAIDARKDGQRTYTYEYDANGNLILGKLFEIYDNDGKMEYGDSVTAEYTYTADGKLESCTHTFYNLHSHDGSIYTETKDVYTYEYDGQGRIVKATVVPGDEIQAANGDVAYQGKAKYAKAEHEFVYGDYYIYNGK
jgi:hypothetical protein